MPKLPFRRSIDLAQPEPTPGMSDLFGRQFRKQTARAKEKLLEGLGKAKATQDDVFDQHATNLVKQSKACERMQRDVKAYGLALKAMVQTQKTLRETIRELYETDWPDREHVCAITQSLDLQWDEYEKIINEQMMGSVNNYMAQFMDLKAKVAKRGRKLVDFDSARNNYNTVKAASKKGDEDPKVMKAATELQQAELMYKDLNQELVDTLPATYDSRITFFVDTLQTLFNAESSNHNDCAKYNKSLVNHLDSLGNAFDGLRVPRPEVFDTQIPESSTISNGGSRASIASAGTDRDSPHLPVQPTPQPRASLTPMPTTPPSESPKPETVGKEPTETVEEEPIRNQVYPSLNASKGSGNELKVDGKDEEGERTSQNPFDDNDSTNPFDEPKQDAVNSIPVQVKQEPQKTSTTNDSPKVLYKACATHHYSAEDNDELTFDAGEVIAVIESSEEDLLDEGWLMGIKQSDGIQGVFPANFTKRI